mgnify:CR=1 FL=1
MEDETEERSRVLITLLESVVEVSGYMKLDRYRVLSQLSLMMDIKEKGIES